SSRWISPRAGPLPAGAAPASVAGPPRAGRPGAATAGRAWLAGRRPAHRGWTCSCFQLVTCRQVQGGTGCPRLSRPLPRSDGCAIAWGTMTAKVALITGANKGIGFETARQLGAQGLTALIGARDEKRGLEAERILHDGGA